MSSAREHMAMPPRLQRKVLSRPSNAAMTPRMPNNSPSEQIGTPSTGMKKTSRAITPNTREVMPRAASGGCD
jgi:hypothetical protein